MKVVVRFARRTIVCLGAAALGAAVLAWRMVGIAAEATFPEKPIKIDVPTQVGCGMDSVACVIMAAEPDGYTVGFWHEGQSRRKPWA